jgi:serine/threonine-protein kinase
MIAPGSKVSRYIIQSQVGSGAASDVYQAWDPLLERHVALKHIRAASERDRREADTVAALHHPKIVALLEILEYDGGLVLVQPWFPDGSLDALLRRRGRLGVTETARLGQDIGTALAFAHAAGILHRDVKPSNVLVDADGGFCLADFGSLGHLDPATGATAGGEIAGTLFYMAPEQVSGSPQTPASDVFGLGMLLYQALYGRVPDEARDGVVALMQRRVSTPIAVPESALQPLLTSCLELDPRRRPQAADAVVKWLAASAAEASPSAPEVFPSGSEVSPQTSDLTQVAAEPLPPTPDLVAADAAQRLDRGSRAWVLAALAIGIATVVALVIVMAGDDSAPPLPTDVPVEDTGTDLTIVWLGLATLVVVGSVAVARVLDRRWSAPMPELDQEVAGVVLGARTRADLSRSLMIEVDKVVQRLERLDEAVLGITVAALVLEYKSAKTSPDRQAALLNVVTVMEKVRAHFAPWHVRHKDAITTSLLVVGSLTGVAGAVAAFLR